MLHGRSGGVHIILSSDDADSESNGSGNRIEAGAATKGLVRPHPEGDSATGDRGLALTTPCWALLWLLQSGR